MGPPRNICSLLLLFIKSKMPHYELYIVPKITFGFFANIPKLLSADCVIPACSEQLNTILVVLIIWFSWMPVTVHWGIIGCTITPNKLAFIKSIIEPNPVMLSPNFWRFIINEAHFWLACYANKVPTITKAISACIFPVEASHWRGLDNKQVTRVAISIPATWTI